MENKRRPYGRASAIIDNNNNNNNDFDNNDNSSNWNFNNSSSTHRTPNQNENLNVNENDQGRSEKRVDFASLSARKPTAKNKAKGKGKQNKSLSLSSPMKPRNILEDAGARHGAEENTNMNMNVALVVEVDTQRMQLISPPPEETLRRTSRLSGQFTPSLLADSYSHSPPRGTSSASATTTKRKRERPQQNARRTDATADSSMATEHDQHSQQQQQQQQQEQEQEQQTPNPKPRKQGRREHARMASMDSPTRPSASSSYGGEENAPTTPTRPRRVLFQSPHKANPDADWIPPAPMLLSLITPVNAATAKERRAVLGARSSRRSATPIPPYEPPKDVFTPPREVYMSPPALKISTRGSAAKKRSPTTTAKKGKSKTNLRVVTTQVKQEIPDDIDLMAPMPPPSPSDDPLLLSGPPEQIVESSPLRERVARRRSVSVQAETQTQAEPEPEVLPPSSPELPLDSEEMHAVHAFDFGFGGNASTDIDMEGDSVMQLDPRDADVAPVRLFDLDDLPDGSGGWSDSDDEMEAPVKAAENGKDKARVGGEGEEEGEGEGEYTGKWRMMKIRTKLDPPSSATRGRMEEWGRPISPFPKGLKLDLVGEEDEEGDGVQGEDAREEEEVRRMSVEPEDEQVPAPVAEEEEEEEEREVRQMSMEFEEEDDLDVSNGEIDISQFTRPVVEDAPPPAREPSPTPTIVASNVNVFDFSSLESPEAGPSNYSMVAVSPSALEAALADDDTSMLDVSAERQQDDDDDDSSAEEDEPGFVKITSADPRAAARAAAILKQHDYECYTKIAMKKHRRASHSAVGDLAKESRRRDVMTSGISKSSAKNRRSMGVIGDQVFIPGTPIMTLPELLQEAEAEVKTPAPGSVSQVWSARARLEAAGQRDPFKTPMVDRRSKAAASSICGSSRDRFSGERAWTKEEWKQLDACFTDQRLDVGAAMEGAGEDTLAPVDMVSIDDVVNRFIAFVGGQDVVQTYGDAWLRDNLLERARALQRKQRSGKIAAPTTPRSSFSFSLSPGLSPVAAAEASPVALGGSRRIPTMEVPDFTPLGRRAGPPPRRSRPVLPAPVVHQAPFANLPPEKEQRSTSKRLPPTLLAPRYSHLLDEAIAISQEGEYRHPAQYEEKEKENGVESADSSFGSNTQSFDRSQEDDLDISQDSEVLGDAEAEAEVVKTPATRVNHNPPNSTLGKRVKGFLFSYLPTLSSKAPQTLPSRKPLATQQRGLPLPPMEVLGKHRGPVITPARPPLPKITPPKELVQLHPAPPIQKPAVLPPRAKRLVELHHLSPPPEPAPVVAKEFVRPRRSSGSSVKDLVKGFEEMQRKEEKEKSLKRVKSIGELGRKQMVGGQEVRPRWKL